MSIELRHLRYFVAVAETLHFGRAAERLGMSQPPLSNQILALERDIGARLLERTNRRVELTEAGRLFLNEARAVLTQVDKAASMAERIHRGEVGEIKIGFFGSAPFLEPCQRILFEYRRAHPDVHLELHEMPTLQQVDALLEQRITIGLVRPVTPLPEPLVATELCREPIVVALRADHPLAKNSAEPIPLAALAQERFVLYARATGTGLYEQVIALCRSAGFVPRVGQEANATPTMMGLVAAGLGVSLLPASMRQLHMQGLVFRSLTDPGAETAMWLAHRRDERAPLARGFIKQASRTMKRVLPPKAESG